MDNVSLDERLAQMSREVREELAEGKDLAGSFFCRMGKLMVEQLLKAEVSESLGRDKSERREAGQAGYRNGYKARTLRTGEGMIELDVPQVRGLEDPYRSLIWQGLGRRSVSLEKLATEMDARGLSVGDIEDLLKELSDDGKTMLLSKSSVSDVTEVLWHSRGMLTPLTVTSAGAPGLIKAIEGMWPEAERIRCWVHKMRNVLTRFPMISGRRSSACCLTSATPPTTRRASGGPRRSSNNTKASCPARWPASRMTWRQASIT